MPVTVDQRPAYWVGWPPVPFGVVGVPDVGVRGRVCGRRCGVVRGASWKRRTALPVGVILRCETEIIKNIRDVIAWSLPWFALRRPVNNPVFFVKVHNFSGSSGSGSMQVNHTR